MPKKAFLNSGSRRYFLGNAALLTARVWPALMAVIALCWFFISLAAAEEADDAQNLFQKQPSSESIDLSDSERAWLKAHQNIKLGYMPGYEPLFLVQPDGSPAGILVDILDEINLRLGTDIGIKVFSSPKQLIEKAQSNEVGGILTLVPDHADALGLLKTRSHIKFYPAIFTRGDVGLHSLVDLEGKTVVIVEKVHFSRKIMAPYKDRVNFIKVDTHPKAIEMLLKGKADAMVGLTLTSYMIDKYQVSGIVPSLILWDHPIVTVIGVRPEWPELVSILNKGIDSFSRDERDAFIRTWIDQISQKKPGLSLSDEERRWLEEHQVLKVAADPVYAPVEFRDEQGQYRGISADYLKILSEMLGVRFEYVPTPRTELVKLGQEGRINLFPSLSITRERQKQFLFSSPYITFPVGVFTRADIPYVGRLKELKGKKVALCRGYATQDWLVTDHPELDPINVETIPEALELLNDGKIDAFIGNMLTSIYYIRKLGYVDLKVAGDTLYTFENRMAVPKDQKILAGIIEKAVAAIPQEKRDNIYGRWVSIRYEHGVDYSLVWKICVALLLIVAGFIFWNRRLAKAVADRTSELADALIDSKRRESEVSALFQATRAIHVSTSFEEAARQIYDVCKKLIGAQAGYVALLSESGNENELLFLDAGGMPCDVDRDLSMPVRGLRGEAYRKGETVFDNDFSKSRWMRFMPKGHMTLENVLFVPLKFGEATVGVIGLANKPGGFTAHDKRLSESFGDVTAVAFQFYREHNSLVESEHRFRSFMENISAGAYIKDEQGRAVYANSQLLENFGYDLYSFIGKTSHDLFPPDIAERIEAADQQVRDKQTALPLEDIQREIKGEKRWSREIKFPLPGPEGQAFVGGIALDVTDRKKSEKEKKKLEKHLRKTQKMEAIGALAGGIAHDFNNILFPIMGYSEILLRDCPPSDPHHNHIQGILSAASRAKGLVKQILAFSRQEEGERLPIKLSPILKEALKLARPTLPTTISIKEDIAQDNCKVMADPTQIHQIAMNLITNAYHAMQENGGQLGVSLKEIKLDSDDLWSNTMLPGKYACISVSDTGAGIELSTMDKIFDPYFSTKDKSKGTGLGLSVVHGIVKKYGGDIKVYSVPGEGSVFSVYLPVIGMAPDVEKFEQNKEIPVGDERILLVDDEEPIIEMEKRVLEKLGYRVTALTSSTEALEAFRSNPDLFDLVITDMTMPDLTGLQLSRQILSIDPCMPIILCTGFSEQITEETCQHEGIQRVLMKPVPILEISTAIRSVLEEGQTKPNP